MALNGTPSADTLSARFDGDEVYGLGGRDVLSSDFYNGTYLDGGVNNDRLTSEYYLWSLPTVGDQLVTLTEVGGDGDDYISAAILGTNWDLDDVTARLSLDGGAGRDTIFVSFGGEAGWFLPLEALIVGGSESDSITITDQHEYTIWGGMNNNISAGGGADNIQIFTSGGLVFVDNKVFGGAGADIIIADAITFDWDGVISPDASNDISGGADNDLIQATAHAWEYEWGTWGFNKVSGDAGDDTIRADSWASNELSGGIGNDDITAVVDQEESYYSLNVSNTLDGGDGDDILSASSRGTRTEFGEGNPDPGVMTNRLTGGLGNDTLKATAFMDDNGLGGRATNVLLAGAGNDNLVATIEAGTLGANRMFGHEGNDRLQSIGGMGNLLNGGPGADTLIAGTGTDTFIGGTGNDTFRFLSTTGSRPSARDTLASEGGVPVFDRPGALLGDRIDVSAIDAKTGTEGFQHFVFGTSHAVGRLWAEDSGSLTLIRGNTGGDSAPELEIAIQDGAVRASAYTDADFLV